MALGWYTCHKRDSVLCCVQEGGIPLDLVTSLLKLDLDVWVQSCVVLVIQTPGISLWEAEGRR